MFVPAHVSPTSPSKYPVYAPKRMAYLMPDHPFAHTGAPISDGGANTLSLPADWVNPLIAPPNTPVAASETSTEVSPKTPPKVSPQTSPKTPKTPQSPKTPTKDKRKAIYHSPSSPLMTPEWILDPAALAIPPVPKSTPVHGALPTTAGVTPRFPRIDENEPLVDLTPKSSSTNSTPTKSGKAPKTPPHLISRWRQRGTPDSSPSGSDMHKAPSVASDDSYVNVCAGDLLPSLVPRSLRPPLRACADGSANERTALLPKPARGRKLSFASVKEKVGKFACFDDEFDQEETWEMIRELRAFGVL